MRRHARSALFAMLAALLAAGCTPAPAPTPPDGAPQRVVSLDYCADQYVLRFADRGAIAALSPDAGKRFSYMRARAAGLPIVRPRAAEVIALQPDLVVRSYGGGPEVEGFLTELGVPVVQIGFPQTLAEVRDEVVRVGSALGAAAEARRVAADMDRRLAALPPSAGPRPTALYMTPGGVTSGEGTLVQEVLTAAGLANFQQRPGWNPLPLERLAYERPDVIVAASFDGADAWSVARHPVARAQTARAPTVPLEGAWTSCGGWFLVDAVEALAEAREAIR
ncbi:ABC transporter substrate-binding protein [Pelagerythrobacter sp.]|uniref:ABC transporter substrate-binding protein n=1 Tax=Pelagerythrobacter sp. TaxID=2800702 RepID=UPI0035B260B5